MKLVKNLIATATMVGTTLVASYLYLPEAYAAIAYQLPFLPVNETIEMAAPDHAYGFKMKRIDKAASELRISRESLIKNRNEIKAMIAEYRNRKTRSDSLLQKAREVYRTKPDAQMIHFVGKDYTRETFSAQIEGINRQAIAQSVSLETLNKALQQLDKMWRELASKQEQLTADYSALSVARTLWKTQSLLDDLHINIDFSMYDNFNQKTTRQLRTVSELLKDQESFGVDQLNTVQPGKGLSLAAKNILTR